MKITLNVQDEHDCYGECYYSPGDILAAEIWGITVEEAHAVHIQEIDILYNVLTMKDKT